VVTIRVVIDKEGRVVSAGIFASSGHRTLDQAALEAVKRAPFDPGRQGATPVSSTGDVVVRFHLN